MPEPLAAATVLLGAAGTGKSTALRALTAELASRRGSERVVGVAADRRSARDWQAAVAREVGGAAPVVTTMTGLAQQLLQGHRFGAPPWQISPGTGDPHDPWGDGELRILTAPEQELAIREVLAGSIPPGDGEGPGVTWPAEWKDALQTRSFARQVRRAVARARRLGWEPDDLMREAAAAEDAGWLALAGFLREYLQILDWQGALDYSEVALRALRRVQAEDPTDGLVVLVDDGHHLDPTQARLLQQIAARGHLIVTADPDQSTASYRGADPAALRLLAADADITVLDRVHRGGAAMRDARARLMGPRWYAGLPGAVAATFRAPAATHEGDRLEAIEFDDPRAQAQHVARRLLQEHRDGLAWGDMAVLVMSPAGESDELVAALGRARIPVHVPTADTALADQPAVSVLLLAAALLDTPDLRAPDTDVLWEALLTSDMCGVTPRRLRELRRWAGDPTADLSWGALAADPAATAACPADLADVVAALGDLSRRLTSAARVESRGGTPAEVLWELWNGADGAWPARLRARALGEGAAAVSAGRDLDAVIEVFRLAERAPERWGGHRSFAVFVAELAHQEIPAEPDLSLGSAGDRVTLMSLHRASGREWPFVVVTGLQESRWRASDSGGLLDVGRLTGDALLDEAPRGAAAEMRRLFGVALSRASRSLLLAACGGPDDPPTRLLADAGLSAVRVTGAPDVPPTPLELGLAARRLAAVGDDEDALTALALLSRARDRDGNPRFPGADPRRWDGISPWTVGVASLRPTDRPLTLSGSALSLLNRCQLRWLLQRELAGDAPAGAAVGFGLIVHAAAAAIAAGDDSDSASLVDREWVDDDYDAPWFARSRYGEAVDAVERARSWLATRGSAVTPEYPIDTVLPVRDATGRELDRIRLVGSADLVEFQPDGLLVWDYKTQRTPTSQADTDDNIQLTVYQAAVESMEARPAAGAGLVHPCVPAGTREPHSPKVRHQTAVAERRERLDDVLRDSAGAIRAESFGVSPGPACRTCPFTALCPAHHSGGAG